MNNDKFENHGFDIMTDEESSPAEKFPLAEKKDAEDSDTVFDMTSSEGVEIFELRDKAVLDTPFENSIRNLSSEDIKNARSVPKPRKSLFPEARILKTVMYSVASVILAFLLWLEGGRLYTEHENENLYKRFKSGEELTITENEAFTFFMSVEGTNIQAPIVKSEKLLPLKTFTSKPFYPGTLALVQDGLNKAVGGNAMNLKDITKDAVGRTIALEGADSTFFYEIVDCHKCKNVFSCASAEGDSLTLFFPVPFQKDTFFAVHALRTNS